MGNFVSGTPNEAVLVSGLSGTRVSVGSTTWRWWVIDTVNRLPLELYQLELQSTEAETLHGVKVTVKAIANVKVKTKISAADGSADKLIVDKQKILLAAQQFLGKKPHEVATLLRQALEGHQRAILGNLAVEQVFRDRASFSQKVREHVVSCATLAFDRFTLAMTNLLFAARRLGQDGFRTHQLLDQGHYR